MSCGPRTTGDARTRIRYNSGVTEAQPPRAEPREIVELRRLKDEQPDLASAVDLQIELLQLQRRVQARVPLPSIRLDSDYLAGLLAAGPLLRFEHLKIDWSDVRFLVRASAGAMRTHEALEPADLRKVEIITRDAERLPFVVRAGYEGTGPGGALPAEVAGLETVLLQAMRPILTRAADAIVARVDLTGWVHGDVSGLRRRTRPGGHHAGRRSPADLQPLPGALAVRSDHVPVLPQRGAVADHVVHQPRRPLPAVGVRRLRAVSQGLRRAPGNPPGDARRRFRRDPAARRGGDAARVQ